VKAANFCYQLADACHIGATQRTPEALGIASDRLGAASISLKIVSLEIDSNVAIPTYLGVIARTSGSTDAAKAAIALELTIVTYYYNWLACVLVAAIRRANILADRSIQRHKQGFVLFPKL
jgi:hypothetical protein